MSKYIVGLDIGYSNLVVACGEAGQGKPEHVVTMPAGAAPAVCMPRSLTGGINLDSGTQVQIDNESWVAGVEPGRISDWTRELHADYPASNTYKALFYAALLVPERDIIDLLVTGLPVNQFQDQSFVASLTERLKGIHRVTPKRSVDVKEVMVVPQPVGTFMSALWYEPEGSSLAETIQRGRAIVIDPGFFSVDWVSFDQASMQGSAGTDLRAMSKVLSEMASLIRADYGAAPTIEKLESAVREGDPDIIFKGTKIEIAEYFQNAADVVSKAALQPLLNDIRLDGGASSIDVVLMGGGGAHAYQAAATALFPHAQIICPVVSVETNARGFWACGDAGEM